MNTTMDNQSATILKGEEPGSFLSLEVSNYLRTYTNGQDRAQASVLSGVGMSLIATLVTRKNPLTDNSMKAVKELVIIAIDKCEQLIKDASKDVESLRAILPEEREES